MKKGDRVVIRNFSYSRFVVNGELINNASPQLRHDVPKGVFIIVETGIRAKSVSFQNGTNFYNNTIIQSVEDGTVGFIEENFLVPANHSITIDGKDIEISHESYLNLKKGLT